MKHGTRIGPWGTPHLKVWCYVYKKWSRVSEEHHILKHGTRIGPWGTPHLEVWCYIYNVGLSITTQGPWTLDQALAG